MNGSFTFYAESGCLDVLCLLGSIPAWIGLMILIKRREVWQQRKKRLDTFSEGRRVSLSRTWAAVGAMRIDPTPAYYYGMPQDRYTWRSELGSLGIAGDWLVFGMARHPFSLQMPVSALRWVSCAILEDAALTGETSLGLMLHFEQGTRWNVRVFQVPAPSGVAAQLHDVLGVSTNMRDFDLAPAAVTVFEQDIYGQWNYQTRGTAYLAPDRLLIGWKTVLRVADLRTITLGPARGLSLTTAWLLRLSYRHGDGSLGGLGLQMDRKEASTWADAMSSRTGVLVQVYDGRKGKDEKLAS
ncbi:hypothetical protein [Aggregatilinea lenta]|uniref:hypothetical protein n=1 Tax=Aggregatilinea lenta TaxID=913108 RepID=UPI000E5AAC9F|nr:hypothetical protein [Aggregatilinea lenta]